MTRGGKAVPSYARAIERALERLQGRPVVLSPRDWDRVSAWQGRGVPLGTILELLEAAVRGPLSRSRSSSGSALSYVAPAVEEAWEVIRDGRPPKLSVGRERRLPLVVARERWVLAAESAGRGSALGSLLSALLEKLDAGEEPSHVDRGLDSELAHVAPADLAAQAEAAAKVALEPYVGRMRAPILGATRRRAVADHLRESLDLPRLAMCDDRR